MRRGTVTGKGDFESLLPISLALILTKIPRTYCNTEIESGTGRRLHVAIVCLFVCFQKYINLFQRYNRDTNQKLKK